MLIAFSAEYVHIHMLWRMLFNGVWKYSILYKKIVASCARRNPVAPD